MLSTDTGKNFEVSSVLEDNYLGALHIKFVNSSIEEVENVFSDSKETKVLTYSDERFNRVYNGYTKLLLTEVEGNGIDVMLSK